MTYGKRLMMAALCAMLTLWVAAPAQGQEKNAAPCHVTGDIPFSYDYAETLAAARENGKPIFAFFTFDACHWCHKLEEGSFSDPAVVKKTGEQFNCVVIDRDFTPELCSKFNVSAYPTMLILNKEERRIFRWSGFTDTEYFLSQVAESLDRFAIYMKGEDWDPTPTRPETVADSGKCGAFPAPVDDMVSGLEIAGGALWVQQKLVLYRIPLDSTSAETEPEQYALPDPDGFSNDMCHDDEWLYIMPMGWRAGKPVQRLNLKTREFGEPLPWTGEGTKSYGSSGCTIADGKAYVIQRMGGELAVVDLQQGTMISKVSISRPGWLIFGLNGLDFDGTHLLATALMQEKAEDAGGIIDRKRSTVNAVLKIDPATGKVEDVLPVNYKLNCLAWNAGTFYLGEFPEFDIDKDHKQVRVFPKVMSIYTYTPEADADGH